MMNECINKLPNLTNLHRRKIGQLSAYQMFRIMIYPLDSNVKRKYFEKLRDCNAMSENVTISATPVPTPVNNGLRTYATFPISRMHGKT